MSDETTQNNESGLSGAEDSVQSGSATKQLPAPAKPKAMPPWKVLLHNDDVNAIEYVIETVSLLTPLNRADAAQRTLEAHMNGVTLLLTTHKERAELYQEQFQSKRLTVTIEAAE